MINRIGDSKRDMPLKTYVERRDRLWAQVIRDNPSYSEAEVTARLEQFGA